MSIRTAILVSLAASCIWKVATRAQPCVCDTPMNSNTGESMCIGYLYSDQTVLSNLSQCWQNYTQLSLYSNTNFKFVGNSFEEFPKGVFDQSPTYFGLYIRNHRVPLRLNPMAFAHLPQLQSVTITNCGVDVIPDDILMGSNISELVIQYNKIKSLPKAMSRDLYNIFTLDLAHNAIEWLPSEIFANMIHLVSLDLSYNRLRNISRDWFSNLKDLTVINLDHNQLKELYQGLFIDLLKTTVFDLNDNYIEIIDESAFYDEKTSKGLINAINDVRINLSGNRLQGNKNLKIVENMIKKLRTLTDLNLGRNLLSGELILRRWSDHSPVTVDLSHNMITAVVIEEENLERQNLQLDLKNNNITNVTYIEFAKEGSAIFPSVFIAGNPLRCDCHLLPLVRRVHDTQLARHVFVEPGDAVCAAPVSLVARPVRDLRIDELTCVLPQPSCPINCTCTERPGAFIQLELDCETLLERSAFENLPYQSISLRLRTLPISLKELSPRIHRLNFTDVGLVHVPYIPKSVLELDLSHNKMNRVPIEMLSPDGPKLRLIDNPFSCSCPLDDILHLIQNNERVSDYQKLTCINGLSVSKIDSKECVEEEAKKQKYVVASVLSVLIILLILTTTLVILFYKHRHEALVYLYARGWCLCCVSEQELDKDRKYDAFVVFSYKDREYVLDNLVPNLESPPHAYKLCVHYRDWVIGDMITEQIVRSVMESRRTIVVLSDNFLSSEWAQQEFRLAHSDAMREGRARVIVILMDDLAQDERLSPELRAYLTTTTYIEKEDPRFWERMRYAMPHRRGS